MNDVIAFLNARLDEDQQAAEGASAEMASRTYGQYTGPVGTHIARHDPARVLADVAAKRKIIDLASEASGLDMQVDGEFRIGPRDEVTEPYVGDLILRHLALPYAGHPDYREEWRP